MLQAQILAMLLSLLLSAPTMAQSTFNNGSPSRNRSLDIYYATTRFNESPSGRPLYIGARHLDLGLGQGSSEYGTVSFVPAPGSASIASSSNWDMLRNEMSARDSYWKQAALGQVNRFSEGEFYNRVRNFHGLICIYIHGYDMNFEDATREMAELADEYQRRSPNQAIMPILFTWPSSGSKADYAGDEAALEWSEKPFRQMVNKLAEVKAGDTSIDLVAHSMGSRLAFWYGMVQGPSVISPPFRNVFMSCADSDYHTAEQRKDDLQRCLSGTLYVLTNDDDGPLLTSALLHVQPRLGRPVDSGMNSSNPVATPLNKQGLTSTASSILAANSQTLLNSMENLLIAKAKQNAAAGNNNSLTQMAVNAILNKSTSSNASRVQTGLSSDPDVQAWLSRNPYLAREYGIKAQLIDDTGLVTINSGHRIAWPLLVGLMLNNPTLSPFVTSPIFKKPDSLLLREMGGTPTYLYKYNKIDLNQLAP